MGKKKFKTFFDYGTSKIRAGVLNEDNESENFYNESELTMAEPFEVNGVIVCGLKQE